MERHMKKKIIFLGLLLFAVSTVMAQIPEEIMYSMKTGNASTLSKYFSQNVELVVLDSENVYSKAHAEKVMSDFFKKNPPQNFTIIHQGGKDDSHYVIGNLMVDKVRYRVYFMVKSKNGISHIHQLRIEQQMQ